MAVFFSRKHYVKKTENEKEAKKDEGVKNKGQLIIDATCTPADIRYPTDMSILNEARMNAENFIDYLYYKFKEYFENTIFILPTYRSGLIHMFPIHRFWHFP
jgi:hypothetical protein